MTEKEMEDRIRVVANRALAILSEHETEVHDGERCEKERANLVAFLIHRLGLYYQDGMRAVISRSREYQEQCQNGAEHGH